MTISRLLSLILCVLYLIFAAIGGGFKGFLYTTAFLLLPMACVWFPDEMGQYTGTSMGKGYINTTTPSCFVTFIGWIFLLFPIFVGIYAMLSS